MMKRYAVVLLLGGLSVSLGMTADSCSVTNGLGLPSRPPPIIVPFGPSENTLQRSFKVELGDYPETQTINWDFGDGSKQSNLPVAQGQTVAHTFVNNGTFQVTVHLFGPRDLASGRGPERIGTGMLPVGVLGSNAPPIVDFILQEVRDDLDQVVPLARRFDAGGSRDADGTIVSFDWDFGDGSSGTGSNVEHTYAMSGRYVIRLTVTDDRGAQSTSTRTLLMNSKPTAQFTFSIDSGNALRVNFDGRGSSDSDGTLTNFSWDFGDGSAAVTGSVVSHLYTVPDDYTVVLTVTDDFGEIATRSQLVDVVGTAVFVRSATPAIGVVDTIVAGVAIDGENFQNGATVQLRQGATILDGAAIQFFSASNVHADFDLHGAVLGDYDVVVTNPDTTTATLTAGFRVVTPDRVRLTTSAGDIVFDLVDDAPITTANFLQYVTDKFYDGTIFHRVVAGFVIQGGGVLPDGTEKPGLRPPIQNEFSPTRSNVRGTVAMAKVGGNPNSATSQFFVNLADNSGSLDSQNGGFTVFANVVEGMDVVDAIAAMPVGGDDRPITDVVIIRVRRE